jgi:hypothetical protein
MIRNPKQRMIVRSKQDHRHLRNIDSLSFVMCRLLAPVLIVNRILFFFFFFCCSHLQNYWSKQGRQALSSLYYLDVYEQDILLFYPLIQKQQKCVKSVVNLIKFQLETFQVFKRRFVSPFFFVEKTMRKTGLEKSNLWIKCQ